MGWYKEMLQDMADIEAEDGRQKFWLIVARGHMPLQWEICQNIHFTLCVRQNKCKFASDIRQNFC